MSARIHDQARWLRWLSVAATIFITAGCAADQSRTGTANAAGCPMNFTLTCEVTRPGATATPSRCRCVRHKDINVLLHGQWLSPPGEGFR